MKKKLLPLLLSILAIGFSMIFTGANLLYGDINEDRSIDSTDLTIIKGYCSKNLLLTT